MGCLTLTELSGSLGGLGRHGPTGWYAGRIRPPAKSLDAGSDFLGPSRLSRFRMELVWAQQWPRAFWSGPRGRAWKRVSPGNMTPPMVKALLKEVLDYDRRQREKRRPVTPAFFAPVRVWAGGYKNPLFRTMESAIGWSAFDCRSGRFSDPRYRKESYEKYSREWWKAACTEMFMRSQRRSFRSRPAGRTATASVSRSPWVSPEVEAARNRRPITLYSSLTTRPRRAPKPKQSFVIRPFVPGSTPKYARVETGSRPRPRTVYQTRQARQARSGERVRSSFIPTAPRRYTQ